jgi:hypothetical protein
MKSGNGTDHMRNSSESIGGASRRPASSSTAGAFADQNRTVVIDRATAGVTGLFGGALMWIVEALAAAPPTHAYHFQAFADSYDLPAGTRTTRSWRDGHIVAVPLLANDMIDFVLEQRTAFSPAADVLALGPDPCRSAVPLDKDLTFERAHRAFADHFRWRPFVTGMVDDFCRREGISEWDTLGVHFRGTDKPGVEGTHVKPELVIEAILDCLMRRDHEFRFRSVFLATDEQPFADMLKDRLCEALGSVRFCALDDPTRVSDGKPLSIHARKSTIPSCDCLTYAAVNMLILSRCAFVLKSPSALSCFAKIMRPSLPLRLVNAFTCGWFPDGAVPHFEASHPGLDRRLAIVQNRAS